jgi:hypothetical protein
MMMSNRTVTEQEVIAALNKHAAAFTIPDYTLVFNELFPELPKVGELIEVVDNGLPGIKGWYPFVGLHNDGRVIVLDEDDNDELWDNYRQQTPVERGEG